MIKRLLCFSMMKNDFFLRYMFLLACFLSIYGTATSQSVAIIGTVTDTSGRLMDGVSITVVNKQRVGTATDKNGRFILEVASGDSLRFSYVGYSDQNVAVTESTRELNIIMTPSVFQAGEEVIVTAFGRKERKEALVGSVTSIQPEDLKIPASNLTTAMAGQIAGMIAYQRTGQPGQDNAAFLYAALQLLVTNKILLS
ncbi:carboxypeptidase-like regulatory domain-containing protein [Niabella ginsengisoli]|uniref:Carboxypeptidase-like regulatory domain-containing protein n=1 Tax=Niabella ginsengisoli TaxID=522298 RepID=A0ABS9SL67_9BACT|nr:carboxypeptidase-like regulatory domain-containing protein [Niabella ginsengisoli]MCH5599127.1 carboxypeptidase-like regulatory domain-containing protein [Niabella ginsengisoli]